MGVDAETNGALGEAGLGQQANAQAGFFAIAIVAGTGSVGSTVTEVTVHIQNAIENIESAVFQKALGLGLAGGHCHLGTARCYCEGDYAPLHHLHRDCSFGLEELRCPTVCYMDSSFFLCRR
ncbi:hypothetical protein D3C86_1559580 [compost metagenome]